MQFKPAYQNTHRHNTQDTPYYFITNNPYPNKHKTTRTQTNKHNYYHYVAPTYPYSPVVPVLYTGGAGVHLAPTSFVLLHIKSFGPMCLWRGWIVEWSGIPTNCAISIRLRHLSVSPLSDTDVSHCPIPISSWRPLEHMNRNK